MVNIFAETMDAPPRRQYGDKSLPGTSLQSDKGTGATEPAVIDFTRESIVDSSVESSFSFARHPRRRRRRSGLGRSATRGPGHVSSVASTTPSLISPPDTPIIRPSIPTCPPDFPQYSRNQPILATHLSDDVNTASRTKACPGHKQSRAKDSGPNRSHFYSVRTLNNYASEDQRVSSNRQESKNKTKWRPRHATSVTFNKRVFAEALDNGDFREGEEASNHTQQRSIRQRRVTAHTKIKLQVALCRREEKITEWRSKRRELRRCLTEDERCTQPTLDHIKSLKMSIERLSGIIGDTHEGSLTDSDILALPRRSAAFNLMYAYQDDPDPCLPILPDIRPC
jgi:hypothetical protein